MQDFHEVLAANIPYAISSRCSCGSILGVMYFSCIDFADIDDPSPEFYHIDPNLLKQTSPKQDKGMALVGPLRTLAVGHTDGIATNRSLNLCTPIQKKG